MAIQFLDLDRSDTSPRLPSTMATLGNMWGGKNEFHQDTKDSVLSEDDYNEVFF